MRPVPHSQDFPVPDPPKQMVLSGKSSEEIMEKEIEDMYF